MLTVCVLNLDLCFDVFVVVFVVWRTAGVVRLIVLLLALNIRSGGFGVVVYCYACYLCGANGCLHLIVSSYA